MPGRGEYGLLAGLGAGLADVAKLGVAATLQEKRDARLAKIAAEAADGKFARDKELLGIQTANRREEQELANTAARDLATHQANEELRTKTELADHYISKGLGANGKPIKADDWEVIEGANEFGEKIPTGVMRGDEFIDFSSPYGQVVKGLIDQGAPITGAVAGARELFALKDRATPGLGGEQPSADAPLNLPPGGAGASRTPVPNGGGQTGGESPRFVDNLNAFLDVSKVVLPQMNPLTRSSGQPSQPDPRFTEIQQRLNNPDPSQRSIPNTQRGGYLSR